MSLMVVIFINGRAKQLVLQPVVITIKKNLSSLCHTLQKINVQYSQNFVFNLVFRVFIVSVLRESREF